ncbi:MAG: S8 family serine peptidase [Gemmatimonadota bacterium]
MHFRSLGTLIAGAALLAAACDSPTEYGDARRAAVVAAEKSVLVGFETAPGAAEIALVESFGGRVTRRFKYVKAVAATIPTDQESALEAAAGVRFVEDNVTMTPFGGKQITDWGVAKIEAPEAWKLGYRGDGVKVGIFDSGIDVDHPDLIVAGGIDLVGDGNGLDDCQGHGTHVAGIVAAKDGARHTVGVAPRAELYSMRFADCAWAGASLDKMIAGLEWAIDNGIDVVNMSFGFGIGGVPLPTLGPLSDGADEALTLAYQAGIVLVAASGNSAAVPVPNNDPYVGWPASHPDVIAVGATDDEDNLSTFSQYGTDQELTAPGVNNLSSYPVGTGIETSLFVDTDIGTEVAAVAMLFSAQTSKKGLTASAIYANLGTAVDYGLQSCTGKTAVVARGGLTFAQKAELARDAGCAALVVHNNQPGNFNGTLGAEVDAQGRPWLPVVSVSLDDGLYLQDQIASKPTTLSLFNVPGNLLVASGTSMASPHAAGVAALILGKNPGWAPADVRNQLRSSANDLGAPGWDPMFGYGRVNARQAVQ